ncbi:hypothetical protein [Mycolicibacterium sp. BiH015]|uniref:hypothetical protein n=1 Tax=Mycolicibacterium sp. BiH015 TaxID=3018808 RepID=UPI0022E29ED0|nr:hypothetical protein [Mycolicibacterium sp. BiH015]
MVLPAAAIVFCLYAIAGWTLGRVSSCAFCRSTDIAYCAYGKWHCAECGNHFHPVQTATPDIHRAASLIRQTLGTPKTTRH